MKALDPDLYDARSAGRVLGGVPAAIVPEMVEPSVVIWRDGKRVPAWTPEDLAE